MGIIIVVLASFLVCQLCITVDAQIDYVNSACTRSSNYTNGSVYDKNLDLLFNHLISKSSSLKFHNSTEGNATDKVYGLYQCREDIDLDDCSKCVKNATLRIIGKCPSNRGGIVWYYECMLRYANTNIFSLPETFPGAYQWSATNISNYAEFAPKFNSTMNDLIKNASSTLPHFASRITKVTAISQLRSSAQCTPDINGSSCNSCLRTALKHMKQCCDASAYAMVVFPSCQLWYDTASPILKGQPATTNQTSPVSLESLSPDTGTIVAMVVCVSFGLIALSVGLWICLSRKKSKETSSSIPLTSSPRELHDGPVNGHVESFEDADCVEFDLATLKTATRDFSDENLLGEGKFGIVYQGTLENGRQVAIKRLSDTSGLDTEEFITEAYLLAKLEHKNLARLVGFCSEGDDKLLVYEYMSNASVDRFLFDPKKRPLLDWVTRFKIIMGIARGLQYLHEDSRLNIVHHDLKPNNILLDNKMNPKIAGFGLAKFFEGEQKHRTTSHTGRPKGYVAPEYTNTMKEDYNEKSDVYSFGIMVLEIVSGQKNRIIYKSPQKADLPLHAWRLWDEGRSFDLTDPALYNNCSSDDVINCIQIGLLCVEANAEQRPTMTEVVHMLMGSLDLPSPSTPAMYAHQFSITDSYTSEKQSDLDQSSPKMVTWRSDLDQDLYPRPS